MDRMIHSSFYENRYINLLMYLGYDLYKVGLGSWVRARRKPHATIIRAFMPEYLDSYVYADLGEEERRIFVDNFDRGLIGETHIDIQRRLKEKLDKIESPKLSWKDLCMKSVINQVDMSKEDIIKKTEKMLDVTFVKEISPLALITSWFIRPTELYSIYARDSNRHLKRIGKVYYQPGAENVVYNITVPYQYYTPIFVLRAPNNSALVGGLTGVVQNSFTPFYKVDMPDAVKRWAEIVFEREMGIVRPSEYWRKSLAICLADLGASNVEQFNALFKEFANIEELVDVAHMVPHYVTKSRKCWHLIWPYIQEPNLSLPELVRSKKYA